MIRVSISEAEDRFEELMEAVEKDGEVVVLCHDGVEVAEIARSQTDASFNRLATDPGLQGKILYDPTEPASEDEWPEESR